MIPGLPQDLLQGSDEEGSLRMKRMLYITDSMSTSELDSDGSLFMETGKDGKPIGLTWRVTRVARGSGTSVREVEELLCQYRMMASVAKSAGGKNGWYVTLLLVDASQFIICTGFKRCKRCSKLGERVAAQVQAQVVCLHQRRYRSCRSVFSTWSCEFQDPKGTSGQCPLECCSKCKGSLRVIMVYKR
jgi:hypothetical protein